MQIQTFAPHKVAGAWLPWLPLAGDLVGHPPLCFDIPMPLFGLMNIYDSKAGLTEWSSVCVHVAALDCRGLKTLV